MSTAQPAPSSSAPSAPPAPYIGEVVHYVSYGTPGGEFPKTCRAAIVTDLPKAEDSSVVSLFVMNPTGLFLNQNLAYSETRAPGTWHYCHTMLGS